MKAILRRIPGLPTLYHHTRVLAGIAYERWWANPRRMNDRSHLTREWNFDAPEEQERHRKVLAAVTKHLGSGCWGEACEFGCGEGAFTRLLAPLCASVTACDVAPVALVVAAKRLAKFPQVRLLERNFITDSLGGSFDVVFVMGVLQFVHGKDILGRVTLKLSAALRDGGLLVVNEVRLPPAIEQSWWARWLGEGGNQYVEFIDGREGFRLIHREVHPTYVIALFEKTKKKLFVRQRVRRHVPASVRAAYHTTWAGLHLLTDLDSSSARSLVEFIRLARALLKIRKDSLISVDWLKGLHHLALDVDCRKVEGDFVECGVFRGGSAALLGYAMTRCTIARRLWLFDSFQGLPKPTRADGPSAETLEGDIVGDEANVRRLLAKVRAPLDRIQIVRGWFHETFPSAAVNRIALLHIDADWYESVKLCLERFYGSVEPGGIVVLDDYFDWPGCQSALNDFLQAHGLEIEVRGGDRHTPPHFRKPA
jgi:O-methyltransferase